MLHYPHLNPVAFHIGPLKVHWYGLMYLLSFLIGWGLIKYRRNKMAVNWTNDQIADLVFYVALGVVIGGRAGYILFYGFSTLIHAPWMIFAVWDGGMSFHGGLIGVAIASYLWTRKVKTPYFTLTDLIAPIAPIGLAAGRFGNFINGFLMGRITDVPWGMIYPYGGSYPRHPIAIYEFLLEGVTLFMILWWYAKKPRPKMAITALFLIGYGTFRCFCELFRQPDPQLGFLAWNWLTMGELLSFPMIMIGLLLFIQSHRKKS